MDYLIEQGVKIDAVITDPPYGTTACSWDNVIPFDKMWDRLKKLRKDKTPIVLFGSEPFSSHLRISNIGEYKYDWIWEKHNGSNSLLCKKQPLNFHEYLSVFYKKQPTYNPQMWKGNPNHTRDDKGKNMNSELMGKTIKRVDTNLDGIKYPRRIIKFNSVRQNKLHPTQKPIKIIKYLIETYTKKGDLILDFTSGSFTTCVASEQLNRRSIGIELERKYCDVGVKRLSQLQMRLDI
jgi:site-specific DNA-methyltransferase (adenine-specific)